MADLRIPGPHEDCAGILREMAASSGAEVTVSTQPPLVRGIYPAEPCTCPHGVTYWIEPTGEQIAEWVKEKEGTP